MIQFKFAQVVFVVICLFVCFFFLVIVFCFYWCSYFIIIYSFCIFCSCNLLDCMHEEVVSQF